MSHEMEIVAGSEALASAKAPHPCPLPDYRERGLNIRVATLEDLPFLDSLQKQHNKQLGYFPTKQFEGYIEMGGVLVAESSGEPVGYCISRDRYLKRDELGVIYQLCVAPGAQRGLIGASLVREVFERSAYGCRLYCCWCAKDLDANHFWEAMGFVPIAFRAGSSRKARVHIFWQKRIVEGDVETKWWYPSQTNQGAIREDRLVFPIPPGVSWKDVEAVTEFRGQSSEVREERKQIGNSKSNASKFANGPLPPTTRRMQFGRPGAIVPAPAPVPAPVEQAKQAEKPKRARPAKVKVNPRLVAAARELRDRYLENVNHDPSQITPTAKYHVTRAIASTAEVGATRVFGAPIRPMLAA